MGTKKKAPKKRAQKTLSLQEEARSESTSIRRLTELAGQSTALARLVARNPKASGPLLKKLGSHSDSTVRKWVTAHPNTPPRVLARLASQFPEQLLDNIAFDVLLLENPNLLEDLPKGTRRSLLKREKCPVSFLEWLAQDDDKGVQLSLAMNSNTPLHVLRKLAELGDEAVATAARNHVNFEPPSTNVCSGRIQEPFAGLREALMAEPTTTADQRLLPALIFLTRTEAAAPDALVDLIRIRATALPLARNRRSSIDELTFLANSPSSNVRAEVAKNLSTPGPILSVLSKDADKYVRRAVVANPYVPASVLRLLANDPEWRVREKVARNRKSPPDVLRRLARDNSPRVKTSVLSNPITPTKVVLTAMEEILANPNCFWRIELFLANHPRTSSDLLAKLARNRDWLVREMVAEHPATSARVLVDLAGDPYWGVRFTVASHPAAPGQALERLAKDRSVGQKSVVAKHPSCPPAVLRQLALSRDTEVLLPVAEHPSTPEEALERLSMKKDIDILCAVASNPSASARALANLARSEDLDVLTAVAENPKTASDTLKRLASSSHRRIRAIVAGHPSTPPEVLEDLYASEDRIVKHTIASNPGCATSFLETLLEERSVTIHRELAGNASLPVERLRKLSMSKDEHIRRQVASNHSTPQDVLRTLMKDRVKRVSTYASREWARRRLAKQATCSDEQGKKRSKKAAPRKTRANLLKTVQAKRLPPRVQPDYKKLDDWRHLARLTSADFESVRELKGIDANRRDRMRKRLTDEFINANSKASKPSMKRLICLLLPDCPTPVLAKAGRSADWKERLAIACHPKTPPAIRQRLANDGNRFVRAAAQQAIEEGA